MSVKKSYKAGFLMIFYEPKAKYNKAILRYIDDQVIYSRERLIDILMEEDRMSYCEAAEHIDYNMQNIGFCDWPIIEEEDPITEEDSEDEE